MIDKQGTENVVPYHLSWLHQDTHTSRKDELPIDDHFSNEHLLAIEKIDASWYVDFVIYLACRILPHNMNYHQKRKFFVDLRYYIWDEPFLLKESVLMPSIGDVYQRRRLEIYSIIVTLHPMVVMQVPQRWSRKLYK